MVHRLQYAAWRPDETTKTLLTRSGEAIMALRTTLAVSAVALAAALSANVWAADDVRSTDTRTIEHSFGRAGGLAGSDRVTGLTAGNQPIGITYDYEVAARTNMSTDRPSTERVGVTYDTEVAARTNMQRGSTKSVVAGQPDGKQAN
jgi:hypothetical protein